MSIRLVNKKGMITMSIDVVDIGSGTYNDRYNDGRIMSTMLIDIVRWEECDVD